MHVPELLEHQLLATKFFAPVTARALISRPRLTTLLQKSLEYPLTLISAPAGFGKTTLLSAWGQSLPTTSPKLAWVSLDEEDNEPILFWTYIVTALNILQPQRFTPLLMDLQSSQPPPLKRVARRLINALVEGTEQFLLILDDYHLITEQQVLTTLAYLIEHLPIQLHIILSTRVDPALPLQQLRARQQLLEIRTDQLRCTTEETKALFKETIGLQMPDEIIQEVTACTEGWLVGLHLVGLSLPEQADPAMLLQEASGDQRYILDYLTQEVLQRQPEQVQTFLLSTSILERLNASLCDAVTQQTGSQQMLLRLEQANLFVVSLDDKRQWYRYHALFAEALRYQLALTHGNLIFTLYHRASLWYAEHDQTTQAILYAFNAHQWHWAADLIERLPLLSFKWGACEHELTLLRGWLEQLPVDIVHSRPRLCLASSQILWTIASPTTQDTWLDAAEAKLRVSLNQLKDEEVTYESLPLDEAKQQKKLLQEQEDLLGEVIATRAFLHSFRENGQVALSRCQQALASLSIQQGNVYVLTCYAQIRVLYTSSANDAPAAVQAGLQASLLAKASGNVVFQIVAMGTTAQYKLATGRLHETYKLTQEALLLGTQPGESVMIPDVGWITLWQAEILREQNQLHTALELAEESISLCKQTTSINSLTFVLHGYAILLRIHLSRGDLEAARSALQEFERIGSSMNQPYHSFIHSFFTTIDQVRLWLSSGELDSATQWTEKLNVPEQHITPFGREREEVARARIFLAKKQPDAALERLKPVLERATRGQRWGHVIEIRLLQALSYQMCREQTKALDALSEAIRLAEPEGYIRSFVDEGVPMETLLHLMRKQSSKQSLIVYLDTLLTTFQQEKTADVPKEEQLKVQVLVEPLSKRELQVLQLLAQGASNQDIARELAIAIGTIKRHVTHIFSKLGVQSRIQAARQAQALGLLNEEK